MRTPKPKTGKKKNKADVQQTNTEFISKALRSKTLNKSSIVSTVSDQIKFQPHKSENLALFSKSFNSVKSSSLLFAFWCIGTGFLFLIVLTFTFPGLAPFSILLMLAGAVTGIASSFTRSGKALTSIRKAGKCVSENNYKQALNHLEKAHSLKPTNALQEQIEELRFYLTAHQK